MIRLRQIEPLVVRRCSGQVVRRCAATLAATRTSCVGDALWYRGLGAGWSEATPRPLDWRLVGRGRGEKLDG